MQKNNNEELTHDSGKELYAWEASNNPAFIHFMDGGLNNRQIIK